MVALPSEFARQATTRGSWAIVGGHAEASVPKRMVRLTEASNLPELYSRTQVSTISAMGNTENEEEVVLVATCAVGQTELDWFESNIRVITEEYGAQWIAVVGNRVVAHGPTFWDTLQGATGAGYEGALIVSADRNAWEKRYR